MRIVSFDLDGTLADTCAEIVEAVNRAMRALALPPAEFDAVVGHIGHGGRELMRSLLADLNVTTVDLDHAHRCFDAGYDEVAGTRSTLYPGCADALRRIAAAGVSIACTTNKNEAFSRRVLAACGIDACFALLVGGDTLPWRKPDGRVLRHVIETLGGDAATTVHVGDSRTDVEAARAAGVAAWAVPWGYNGGEPVSTAQPDRQFDSFAAIADAVIGTPPIAAARGEVGRSKRP